MTKLTCITTTFNDGPALMTSVASILAQSFTDFQLILVDDGSTDETVDLVASLTDPRILKIRQANDGLSGARNKALDQAAGDYVCFLDADDSRPQWAFQSMADRIDRDLPDLILCQGMLSEVRGELLPFYDAPVFDRLEALCPIGTFRRGDQNFDRLRPIAQLIEPQSANKVVNRAFLKRTGIGFPNTHFFEDVFFHSNLLAAADVVAFLPVPCFTYYRRYLRPQITATSGDLRFDIIAVTKLTLENFARRAEFHDPSHRAAVLASCLKYVEWCENTIAHYHRHAFRVAARGMILLVNPLYFHFPASLPADIGDLTPMRLYLEGLTHVA